MSSISIMSGNHVEKISPIQTHSFVESFYEISDVSHFWFQWRFAAMLVQLKSLGIPLDEELKVLDVGGGVGVLRTQTEAATNWNVDLTDLDYKALCTSSPGRGRTIYYDIFEEREGFKEAYDVLMLYDVLEHIPDTKPFLQSIIKHIKPNGLLLINVPALQILYSIYDKAQGHIRRYNLKTLSEEFADLSIEVKDVRYWGMSLLPLTLVRKFIMKGYKNLPPEIIMEKGFKPPSNFVNDLLKVFMKIEIGLMSKPPLGASVLLVGEKK